MVVGSIPTGGFFCVGCYISLCMQRHGLDLPRAPAPRGITSLHLHVEGFCRIYVFTIMLICLMSYSLRCLAAHQLIRIPYLWTFAGRTLTSRVELKRACSGREWIISILVDLMSVVVISRSIANACRLQEIVTCGVRTHAQLPAVDLKSTPLTTRAK